MQDSPPVFDAIVVGSGPTGAWAAKQIAESGFSVLVLEAGPHLAPSAMRASSTWAEQRQSAAETRQRVQATHNQYWQHNPELFVDDVENPYATPPGRAYNWIRGRQVGGRSLLWGGITLRFSDSQFGTPPSRCAGGAWPIRHRDLARYYETIERYMGVEGTHEALDEVPDGEFIAPGALSFTEQSFKCAVEKRWSDRKVIHCRGIARQAPGLEGAWPRQSMLDRVLPDALATGRVTLRPDTIAAKLLLRADGTVAGVGCIDRLAGKELEVCGRAVVLCASTIETVRILANSRSRAHPRGVGNSTDQLGRFLLDHAAVSLSGAGAARGAPRGGRPENAHGILVPPPERAAMQPDAPAFGIWGRLDTPETERDSTERQLWFLSASIESEARPDNRIELDGTLTDERNLPAPRIEFSYSDRDLSERSRAHATLIEMTRCAGLTAQWEKNYPPGALVHEVGGARMGSDRQRSVVDPLNHCWDARNVVVADGACFVTAGWQNPTLTMMAIALRASEAVAQNLRSGAY